MSAKEGGEPPLVTREMVRRWGFKDLGQAISRDGKVLMPLRTALAGVRVLSG